MKIFVLYFDAVYKVQYFAKCHFFVRGVGIAVGILSAINEFSQFRV